MAATATATQSTPDLERFHQRGYCILPKLLPTELVDEWQSAFAPLYRRWRSCGLPDNRGPFRNYLDLPFAPPFSNAAVYEHPEILDMVMAIIGTDPVLLHFGTDTPELGSEPQDVHSDVVSLFPETGTVTPTYCVTVNFPLVDITPANGPFEVAPGTHRLGFDDAQARISRGEIALEPVFMQRGDVLIRDPRTLHRGTANRTDEPRPVVVLSFQRPWYRHQGFEPMAICPTVRDTLSDRARRMLRLHLPPPRMV